MPYPHSGLLCHAGRVSFSSAVSECGHSLITNSALISKVYFPRMTIPASSLITSLVDLLIPPACWRLLMVWYQFVPGPRVFLLLCSSCWSLRRPSAPACGISALMVKPGFPIHRAIHRSVSAYTLAGRVQQPRVPAQWRFLYSLNPMVVIDGFRWAILGGDAFVLAGFVCRSWSTPRCW